MILSPSEFSAVGCFATSEIEFCGIAVPSEVYLMYTGLVGSFTGIGPFLSRASLAGSPKGLLLPPLLRQLIILS